MTRYYFHIHDRAGQLRDEEGCELRDLEAVRERAIHDARSLMAADVEAGRLDLTDYVEVADDRGAVVLTLPFAEAVLIARPKPVQG
jgi:hypothetical protein